LDEIEGEAVTNDRARTIRFMTMTMMMMMIGRIMANTTTNASQTSL
jgi:hypothetical protein